ncbi:MAG: glycoside hydrolase family 140 protein [Kiritimatiellae bacterium]|nr:glycoside hydrolase family 140 protein [Kiritimatiellia bacterium]
MDWRLNISKDRRSLERADGTPWFWLGDTAWALFIHLNRDEVKRYFADRQAKGFTVIQAVALMGYNVDFNQPNVYGHRPLLDNDPTRPDTRGDENFWTHADYIVDTAAEHGLYIGLLPTWGYHIGGNHETPIRFTMDSGCAYAEWISRRYAKRPNIIWINGGDVRGNERDPEDRAIWNAMGAIYKRNCPDHLVTFHPRGNSSSALCFHGEEWLDFNMIQSSHARLGLRNDLMIETDCQRPCAKPVLDGEPRYEAHPVGRLPQRGFFTDYDVRQAAYWSLFAGSFGHTYGHVNLWRFNVPGKVRTKERFEMMDLYWIDLLDSPGAWQMKAVRDLMLSRPHAGRGAAQSLLRAPGEGERTQRATRGDGYVFAYSPYGDPIELDVPWQDFDAWWYDPRTGAARPEEASGTSFTPPGHPYRGNDWVLVVDEGARHYPPPGQISRAQ